MKRSILLVDDEASIRQSLQGVLADEFFDVTVASSGEEALEQLQQNYFDLLLLDIWLEGMSGLKVLAEVKELYPEIVTVVMSGHANVGTAVKATKLGAFDFVEKPLSLDKLLVILKNAIDFSNLYKENRRLKAEVYDNVEMIGSAPKILALKEQIRAVAPLQSWVLITGESGTGKELVASAIYQNSSRKDKPFVETNCAAIPEDLIESELFGHERGAFTGATQLRRGKFELANEGTLFLDEVADMSLKTQARILRVLEEQRFERVGGNQTHMVDVRVIAATNKNLAKEVMENRFRADLLYRLNVVPIHVPPLRERKEDILPLLKYYFNIYARDFLRTPKYLSSEASSVLQKYSWPGNVRELRNLTEHLSIMVRTDEVGIGDLPVEIYSVVNGSGDLSFDGEGEEGSPDNLRRARNKFEREFILEKLQEHKWNVSKTAQTLGIERTHLHRRMKMFNIRSLEKK